MASSSSNSSSSSLSSSSTPLDVGTDVRLMLSQGNRADNVFSHLHFEHLSGRGLCGFLTDLDLSSLRSTCREVNEAMEYSGVLMKRDIARACRKSDISAVRKVLRHEYMTAAKLSAQFRMIPDEGTHRSKGWTALYWAIMTMNTTGREDLEALVLELIERGAAVNIAPSTPLLRAAAYGQTRICSKLIEKGGFVDVGNSNGTTPLMLAIENGHVETVRVLLGQGANPDVREWCGSRTAREMLENPRGGSHVRTAQVADLLQSSGGVGGTAVKLPNLPKPGS